MAALNHDEAEKLTNLPTLGQDDNSSGVNVADRKSDSVEIVDEKDLAYLDADNSFRDDDVVLLKGEPVVTSGKDVSRFVIDLRDDGEVALTFRSLFLGTVMAGLGAALCQVRLYLPTFHLLD
jgi:hypothetical protein